MRTHTHTHNTWHKPQCRETTIKMSFLLSSPTHSKYFLCFIILLQESFVEFLCLKPQGLWLKCLVIITECPWIIFHLRASGRYSGISQNVSCPTLGHFSQYASRSAKTCFGELSLQCCKRNETCWLRVCHSIIVFFFFFP